MSLVALSARSEQTTEVDGVTFRWLPLTKRQTIEVLQAEGETQLSQGLSVFCRAVTGWDLKDEEGNAVPWSRDPEANADRVPWEAMMKVSSEILAATRVTEGQAGN